MAQDKETKRTDPTIPIEMTLGDFSGGHGYVTIKMTYPLKRISIDLLCGEASYFEKPKMIEHFPIHSAMEMSILEDLKKKENEDA